MRRLSTTSSIILAFVVIKILLHLCTADQLGFHRDEFLYLALGQHPAWGFWSNPPLIGAITWFSQNLLGDSVFATRLPSALAGGGLLFISGLLVRELGGGRFAQLVCGCAMLFSIAWLRTFSMLQPVPFDIVCWAFLSYALLKWINSGNTQWWWWIGVGVGLGFLNKYTLLFWVAALLPALLLGPARRILLHKDLWIGAGVALIIFLPNLLWQWQHHFPVLKHMEELARNQLDHVDPVNFLVDQLMMQGPGGALVWLAGLLFLLRAGIMRPYRLLGWFYLCILLLFLALNGKGYYTLGAYPVLLAAGAVFWERTLRRVWTRAVLIFLIIALALPLFPVGIPLWPAEKLVAYFQRLTNAGIEVVRWEDGALHALPQDYADMLGWQELANIVDSAVLKTGISNTVIYGENYGQAGAVSHLGGSALRARTFSFSDSYRLWAPDSLPAGTNTLIYINDELGADISALFADIEQAGSIKNPLARERGTGVWICRQPRSDMNQFWMERVREIKRIYEIPDR